MVEECFSMRYVWCNKEECRIPAFRCLFCKMDCYADEHAGGDTHRMFEYLVESGKFKERYVMKRKRSVKDNVIPIEAENEGKEDRTMAESGEQFRERIFLLEDGKLKPFAPEEYTTSTLYRVIESFSVECRLVRPEDPNTMVFEGKKPSKKTVPIVITRNGDSILLGSWEELESRPADLSDAVEVIGAAPAKQVFVLKKK